MLANFIARYRVLNILLSCIIIVSFVLPSPAYAEPLAREKECLSPYYISQILKEFDGRLNTALFRERAVSFTSAWIGKYAEILSKKMVARVDDLVKQGMLFSLEDGKKELILQIRDWAVSSGADEERIAMLIGAVEREFQAIATGKTMEQAVNEIGQNLLPEETIPEAAPAPTGSATYEVDRVASASPSGQDLNTEREEGAVAQDESLKSLPQVPENRFITFLENMLYIPLEDMTLQDKKIMKGVVYFGLFLEPLVMFLWILFLRNCIQYLHGIKPLPPGATLGCELGGLIVTGVLGFASAAIINYQIISFVVKSSTIWKFRKRYNENRHSAIAILEEGARSENNAIVRFTIKKLGRIALYPELTERAVVLLENITQAESLPGKIRKQAVRELQRILDQRPQERRERQLERIMDALARTRVAIDGLVSEEELEAFEKEARYLFRGDVGYGRRIFKELVDKDIARLKEIYVDMSPREALRLVFQAYLSGRWQRMRLVRALRGVSRARPHHRLLRSVLGILRGSMERVSKDFGLEGEVLADLILGRVPQVAEQVSTDTAAEEQARPHEPEVDLEQQSPSGTDETQERIDQEAQELKWINQAVYTALADIESVGKLTRWQRFARLLGYDPWLIEWAKTHSRFYDSSVARQLSEEQREYLVQSLFLLLGKWLFGRECIRRVRDLRLDIGRCRNQLIGIAAGQPLFLEAGRVKENFSALAHLIAMYPHLSNRSRRDASDWIKYFIGFDIEYLHLDISVEVNAFMLRMEILLSLCDELRQPGLKQAIVEIIKDISFKAGKDTIGDLLVQSVSDQERLRAERRQEQADSTVARVEALRVVGSGQQNGMIPPVPGQASEVPPAADDQPRQERDRETEEQQSPSGTEFQRFVKDAEQFAGWLEKAPANAKRSDCPEKTIWVDPQRIAWALYLRFLYDGSMKRAGEEAQRIVTILADRRHEGPLFRNLLTEVISNYRRDSFPRSFDKDQYRQWCEKAALLEKGKVSQDPLVGRWHQLLSSHLASIKRNGIVPLIKLRELKDFTLLTAHPSLLKEGEEEAVLGIRVTGALNETSAERALYQTGQSLLPICLERNNGRVVDEQLETLMDRASNSIVLVTSPRDTFTTFRSRTGRQITLQENPYYDKNVELAATQQIDLSEITHILVPTHLYPLVQAVFADTGITIVNVGARWEEVAILELYYNYFGGDEFGHSFPGYSMVVPDYETALLDICSDAKTPRFLHVVRLPTIADAIPAEERRPKEPQSPSGTTATYEVDRVGSARPTERLPGEDIGRSGRPARPDDTISQFDSSSGGASPSGTGQEMTRRDFLRMGAVLTATALAGCGGQIDRGQSSSPYSVPLPLDLTPEERTIRERIKKDMGVVIADGELRLTVRELRYFEGVLYSFHELGLIQGVVNFLVFKPTPPGEFLVSLQGQADYNNKALILYCVQLDDQKRVFVSQHDIQEIEVTKRLVATNAVLIINHTLNAFAHELGHLVFWHHPYTAYAGRFKRLNQISEVSEKRSDEYISKYAQTNVDEDFAETFAFMSVWNAFDVMAHYPTLYDAYQDDRPVLLAKLITVMEYFISPDGRAKTIILTTPEGAIFREWQSDAPFIDLAPTLFSYPVERNDIGEIDSFGIPDRSLIYYVFNGPEQFTGIWSKVKPYIDAKENIARSESGWLDGSASPSGIIQIPPQEEVLLIGSSSPILAVSAAIEAVTTGNELITRRLTLGIGEEAIDMSNLVIVMPQSWADKKLQGRGIAEQSTDGSIPSALLEQPCQKMLQALRKEYPNELNIIGVSTQEELIETVERLSKDHKVIVLGDTTFTQGLEKDRFSSQAQANSCIVSADLSQQLEQGEIRFINLHAMALVGVGILYHERSLFQMAYELFTGNTVPPEALNDFDQKVLFIIRGLPRIIRVNADDIDDQYRLNKLYAVAA